MQEDGTADGEAVAVGAPRRHCEVLRRESSVGRICGIVRCGSVVEFSLLCIMIYL